MLAMAPPAPSAGATFDVRPGDSVQAAIDAARDGDAIAIAAGEFVGDLDFRGKAIRVAGMGPGTVLRGSGTGPVVTFAGGESRETVLDSVAITGGLADRGGGIFVRAASPRIVRVVVSGNRARFQGSGIYLEDSHAEVTNSLVHRNTTLSPRVGDAHAIDVTRGAPSLVNDTIADNDSNGIILRGSIAAHVRNNVIAYNGSSRFDTRGRGICDFGRDTVIQHNLFFSNRRGALLVDRDYQRIEVAERALDSPRLAHNRSGAPRFANRRKGDYRLLRNSRAIDLGDPDGAFDDRDGSRNDAGHTGGPLGAPLL
jgi:putative cofactor-binding repeat protein